MSMAGQEPERQVPEEEPQDQAVEADDEVDDSEDLDVTEGKDVKGGRVKPAF